jgi:heme/copper-type cytochrome/quinol oxidase subunit 2
MLKNHNLLKYLWYSVISAVLFSITVVIFLSSGDYTSTWWLFVGNGLFMLGVLYFMWSYNKTKREDASASSLVIAGHLTTILGIVISSIIAAILLIFYVPGIFSGGETAVTVEGAPATIDTGKTDGLVFMVFMCAIVGNVSSGSFASIIFAYTAKRDQTKDSAEIKYKVPR